MPPIAPPWSQLTAYDLNKGTILWQVPNGDSLQLVGRGVRGTGSHQARAGMVVTAGGLVFIGTPDNTLRAYDEDSGKVVWEKQVSGPINGVPAVYEIERPPVSRGRCRSCRHAGRRQRAVAWTNRQRVTSCSR